MLLVNAIIDKRMSVCQRETDVGGYRESTSSSCVDLCDDSRPNTKCELRVISPRPGGTNEQENEDDDSAGTGLSSYQMYAYGIADLEIDQTSANTAQMLKPSLTKCKFNNLI